MTTTYFVIRGKGITAIIINNCKQGSNTLSLQFLDLHFEIRMYIKPLSETMDIIMLPCKTLVKNKCEYGNSLLNIKIYRKIYYHYFQYGCKSKYCLSMLNRRSVKPKDPKCIFGRRR